MREIQYQQLQQPVLTPSPSTVIFFEVPGATPQFPPARMHGIIVQEPLFFMPWFATSDAMPTFARRIVTGETLQEPVFTPTAAAVPLWFTGTETMPTFPRPRAQFETLTLPVETPEPPPPPPPPTTIPGPVGGGDNSLIRGQIPPGPRRGDVLPCSIRSQPLSFIAAASCAHVIAFSVASRPMRCVAQADAAQVMATSVQSTPVIFTAEARAMLGTDANDASMLGLPGEEIV